jgi:RNA polymerase sigma-70 factor (ECF subfamily)
VLGVINRLIKDPNESLDVLQETFIKAYRAINDFRGDSKFYTWLYRIAVNTAKSHIQGLERRRQVSKELEDSDAETLIQKDQGDYAAEHHLLKAFDQLPKTLKAAMTLREIGGLTYSEIAEVMNVPIGTIRSRIFRARALLRKGSSQRSIK